MPPQTRYGLRARPPPPPPAMPRGREAAQSKAPPVDTTQENAHTTGKHPHGSLDASAGASTPKKRHKKSVSVPKVAILSTSGSSSSSTPSAAVKAKVASLRSKFDTHEVALKSLSDRVFALESRMPSTGHSAVVPSDVTIVDHVQHGAPNHGQHIVIPHVPGPDSNGNNNNNTADTDNVAVIIAPQQHEALRNDDGDGVGVGKATRLPEQIRRWNGEFFGMIAMERLETLWLHVRVAVNRLAKIAFPEHFSMDQLNSNTADWISSWAPNFREYVHRYNGTPYLSSLYEAMVWRLLDEELFSSQNVKKWQDGAWAGLGAVLNQVKPDVTKIDDPINIDFFLSKQAMARMIYMSDTRSHVNREYLEHTMCDRLARLQVIMFGEAYDRMREALEILLNFAIQTDMYLVTSRLDICVSMRHPETGQTHGFPFRGLEEVEFDFDNPPTEDVIPLMQDKHGLLATVRDEREGRSVAFICEPALLIRGESRGRCRPGDTHVERMLCCTYVDSYHVERVKSYMQVVLEPKPEDRLRTPWLLGRTEVIGVLAQ